MAEKLKNLFFTPESLNNLVVAIKRQYPEFEEKKFLNLIHSEEWNNMELKEKMRHTATCLRQSLPNEYLEALIILVKAAPEVKGFEAMSLPDFVEQYGMDHWEESLNALGHFTRYSSSEFAIRPFLDQKPEVVMHFMNHWAEDKHENVRRFASEGCRPRLPWAMVLPKFIIDPQPVIEILEKLKDDQSEFVRRSVANNLNDISKDNPEIALDVAQRWFGRSERTDWIVKHAMRTLLKQGNEKALRLFGFGDPGKLEIKNLQADKTAIKIGDSMNFSFDLINKEKEDKKVRLEYEIEFVKASGKRSGKIFQIIEKNIEPGSHTFKRKHSFADMTTRKHYPGKHKISIVVNGIKKAGIEFILIPSL
jgi:3-methyladenine DNA glycosylase AlkC